MFTFQDMIQKLAAFWEKQGCLIGQGYDLEVGAGTFNPHTFLRSLGPEPYKAFYVEPSRRPTDGRYGTNPNRLQFYFQGQVILKPSPKEIQELCLQSLEAIGFKLEEHDVRFVHDDWEAPTLGAWGLGWEVWMDGMEVTQFTYFQSVAGIPQSPVTGEVTYGLERLAMHLQKVNSIFDIQWNDQVKYGDIYQQNEVEWSHYNFEHASTEMWHRHFQDYEKEAKRLAAANLPIPAYDFVIKASHAFNMLDARGVISVTERTGYIARIRDLACTVAAAYLKSRQEQGFPLLDKFIDKQKAEPQTQPLVLVTELTSPSADDKEDFLLEIGSEELPSTFVTIGCNNLEKSMKALLEKEGIPYKSLKTMGTPRRLAVYVEQMSLQKPEQQIEKRGPAIEQAYDVDGSLKPAGEGFFRSLGITPPSLAQIRSGQGNGVEIRTIKGLEYLFASVKVAGKPTADILVEQLPGLILGLDFPKKMRWGDLDIAYARPLRWICALLGDHVVPFTVGNIRSGRESTGHRQLKPWNFSIIRASDYMHILREHKVIVDANERKRMILEQVDALEGEFGGKIIARDRVLPEVVNLVEWPFVTHANFDAAFLNAPKEVLISEMVEHQKYFPVENKDGTLQNRFVITANTKPTDIIRQGNQKALSPRLNDGVFLYKQGLDTKLDHYKEKLNHITFQKELGSLGDKAKRLEAHGLLLQKYLKISSPEKVKRAAELCKADIATEMVYEFPELQGSIGRYYALAQGEDPEVATAITEHWMPRGENTPLPETETGIILSLADKIDNLIGCYYANLKPSSSSDPYALRRQALGLIKIVIRGEYRLPLGEVLREGLKQFPNGNETLISEIEAFLSNRIKTVFLDYGFNKDEIEAGLSQGFSDIFDAYCKVKALHRFRKENARFPLLCEVYKRAKGQINNSEPMPFSAEILTENAEKNLYQLLSSVSVKFDQAIEKQNYDNAYALISEIQPALAQLFDEVKILADDPKVRNNRIALLQKVFALFGRLLDFGKLQF